MANRDMRHNDCRDPRPAPFAVGQRLRFKGTRQIGYRAKTGETVWVLYPNAELVVVRVKAGWRGTGRQLRDEDGLMFDDAGEPIRDTTRDGYSVVKRDPDCPEESGRCIDPNDVDEWEVIP